MHSRRSWAWTRPRGGGRAAHGIPPRPGDPRAFEALYARHARRVAGLCRRLLGPCPEVEEAVNEVFLKMSRSLPRLDAGSPVAPWLLATASHHCLNLLRRRGLERAHFAAALPDRKST